MIIEVGDGHKSTLGIHIMGVFTNFRKIGGFHELGCWISGDNGGLEIQYAVSLL